MLWDIFCRVIDNFGDIGVCWRLSADLTQRGHQVRLWVDDASALAWMAPGQTQVSVLPWDDAQHNPPTPGDVVIEAFGCDPPDEFVFHMQRPHPPRWINLEYLSAEDYVERSHTLPSPVWNGAGAGLRKWFFYPGFTPLTGGLIRETNLLERRSAFVSNDQVKQAWLAKLGIEVEPGERLVSVFCYDSAPLPQLLESLQTSTPAEEAPITLLLASGPACDLSRPWLTEANRAQALREFQVRLIELPPLTQADYDQLLWCCDLNFVRGEDSAVRALWAGKPHIWQIYEQDDEVHADKLEAFMHHWMADWPPELASEVRGVWRSWNQLNSAPIKLRQALNLADRAGAWSHFSAKSCANLSLQADLSTQLIDFVTRSG